MWQTVEYMERMATYMFFGTPLLGLMSVNYLVGGRLPEMENYTWGYLVWAAQRLGPCFVKLAQWASTRPDLFPPKLIEHIVVLQDDVKVNYPFSMVENTLATAFGKDWKDHLVIDPKPLGAGSVAQVFRGVMTKKDKSEVDVAVKLIHPDVEKLIRTDMEILNMFVDWIDTFPSLEMLSLGDTARQFADCMNAQMDLRKEASHLVKFGKKFAQDDWAVFPQPVEGYVTKYALVETLMLGTPINTYMALSDKVALKLKRKLADLGARLILKMVFFDNFIHGDLHPGKVVFLVAIVNLLCG
jgi:aarF domain-containing kinase